MFIIHFRYIKHSLAELEAEREEATKQKHMEFEVKKVCN